MQTLKSQSGLPASASRIRSSSLSVPVITSLLCARFLPSHLSSVRHPCLSLPNTSHWFTATSCQCYCKSFLVALINPLTYPSRNYLRHFSEMNLALVSLLSKYSQRMTRDSIFLKNKYNYFCLSFSFKHLMIPPPPSSNLKHMPRSLPNASPATNSPCVLLSTVSAESPWSLNREDLPSDKFTGATHGWQSVV